MIFWWRMVAGGDAVGDQVDDPFADVDGQDVGHFHGAEPGDDVPVEVVAVGLAGGGFHDVVGQPLVGDVVGEARLSGAGVAGVAGVLEGFGVAPGGVGGFLAGEGAGGAAPAAAVVVVGGVAGDAGLADSFAALPHDPLHSDQVTLV